MAAIAQPRKLSVSEVIAMRDKGGPGVSAVTDATGRRLTNDQVRDNGPYRINGWNTSGVGPGTRGYRGSGKIMGYSGQSQGTGSDYIRQHGGLSARRPSLLNELYLNQPGRTMGAFDALQSQREMDEVDPNSAFYADQAAVARGQGQYEKADLFQSMLNNQIAQRLAGGPGASAATMAEVGQGMLDGPGAPESPTIAAAQGAGPYPSSRINPATGEPVGPAQPEAAPTAMDGEIRFAEDGSQWQYNAELGRGEKISEGPTFADALADRQRTHTIVPGAGPGEAQLFSRYGTGSVTDTPTETAFTDGHGSRMGGVDFTGQRGTQGAAEFFQDAADFKRTGNRFAQPSPGYDGQPMQRNSPSWAAYTSAMDKKKLLGKR